MKGGWERDEGKVGEGRREGGRRMKGGWERAPDEGRAGED